jgi:hypothetical protein
MSLYTTQNAEQKTDARGRERRRIEVVQVRDGKDRTLGVFREKEDGSVFIRVSIADVRFGIEDKQRR